MEIAIIDNLMIIGEHLGGTEGPSKASVGYTR